MACALRLSQLIDEHNARHPDAPLSKDNIYVLEKAREIGAHCLSGALLDPAFHASSCCRISRTKRRSKPRLSKKRSTTSPAPASSSCPSLRPRCAITATM